jgi:hypothetical protein
VAVTALLFATTDAAADPSEPVSESTEPLPRTSYLRLEPSYTIVAGGGSASELHVRAVFVARGDEIDQGRDVRVWGVGVDQSLHEEATRTAHASGFGDLGLTLLFGSGSRRKLLGVGIAVELPVATTPTFGSGTFRIGPAWFAQTSALPRFDLSILVRTYFAAGHAVDRAAAFSTKLEPGIAVSLAEGFQLLSNGEIEIDWLASNSTVPIDVQLGRRFGKHVFVAFGPQFDIVGRDRGNVRFELQIDFTHL